jgi:hypothetical protein
MRAVWSWWTKPLLAGRGWFWPSPRHHLLSWILSVETARRHHPRTSLVTDDRGAALLVERLGLEFEHVSTALNALDGHDAEWWNLGKLLAYSLQTEPFVHLDQDVYLWEPLPERLLSADVFAQNPEPFTLGLSDYRPEVLEHALHSVGGWVPEEMTHCLPIHGMLRGACCGILGGRRVDFIRHYAELALRLVEHPRNAPAWPRLGDKQYYTTVLEQYLLEACVRFHEAREGSPFQGVSIRYLFESPGDAYEQADAAGYTHLLGTAKRDAEILRRLEERVRLDYPALYRRADLACLSDPVAA